MRTPTFPAFHFNGLDAEARPVVVGVESGYLVVANPDGALLDRQRLDAVAVSEAFRHAPRLIALPDGVTLEVPDPEQDFARALRAAGLRPSPVVRLQQRPAVVVLALVALIALLAGAYFKGLPAAARWLAFALPARLEARMGEQVLAVLDQHYFRPSRFGTARRARLAERFAHAAAATAPGVSYRLEFRAAGANAVNAFTLPGGIIILLDGLVDFATDDDAVLGVLGHELGHVVHKHPTRQIFQSVGVGAIAGLLWGDFSGAATSAAVVVGVLRYSRDFEREADDFAVAFLRSERLSAGALYSFFERVRRRELGRGGRMPEFASTHPSTEERLERFRREIR